MKRVLNLIELLVFLNKFKFSWKFLYIEKKSTISLSGLVLLQTYFSKLQTLRTQLSDWLDSQRSVLGSDDVMPSSDDVMAANSSLALDVRQARAELSEVNSFHGG